ncbi:MAG: beta-N-acetylhexosaminidase [Gemmatimonadetes bacterium]|nr:beta-N-acetylhexosaminidase [Gemmatimonadota bacterium]
MCALGPAGNTGLEAQTADPDRYPLVPWPRALEARAGAFTVDSTTRVVLPAAGEAGAAAHAAPWLDALRVASGFPLEVVAPEEAPARNVVTFVLEADAATGDEGYTLDVSDDRIIARAGTPTGLFYAAQTLRQLTPRHIERAGLLRAGPPEGWAIPAVSIRDEPRFSWRGLHLDVGRHFFGVEFVKRYLDQMASFKFNRFHWHLTEDQGWRIEIEAYPKLTEVGAWRDGTLVGHYGNRPHTFDGERYGGFYTQDEIREIVAYAAARHITVVPEIELPGHSSAALAAYPEFGCGEGPVEVAQLWGVFEDIYCPHERTFGFLETVFDEVLDLFPSPWIHIGGDEAPKAQWERSAAAQEVIRREGLADERELQSWFIRRIERHLNAAGRRLIGWDEIVEGGLSPTATLMFWRDWNAEALELAASQGNDVVMTPNSVMYFDHYQADPEGEPVAIGGLTTLEDVYAFDPVPEPFRGGGEDRILGAQANLWTEYIPTPQKAEYMAYPRAVALAEVVWSAEDHRDWTSFQARLSPILERLDLRSVNYRRPDR